MFCVIPLHKRAKITSKPIVKWSIFIKAICFDNWRVVGYMWWCHIHQVASEWPMCMISALWLGICCCPTGMLDARQRWKASNQKCASQLVDMFCKANTLIISLFYGNWKLKPCCLTIWGSFQDLNTKFGFSNILAMHGKMIYLTRFFICLSVHMIM